VVQALVRELASLELEPLSTSGLRGFIQALQRLMQLKDRFLPGCFRNPRRFFALDTFDHEWKVLPRMAPQAPPLASGSPNPPESPSSARRPGLRAAPVNTGDEQPENTTHLVVWDRRGMIVSMTLTLGSHFGTGDFCPLGFFYNNELRLFRFASAAPADPEADEGPITTKCPILVLRDDRPILALGGAGNTRIIANVAYVLWSVLVGNLALPQAVAAPRLSLATNGNVGLEWHIGVETDLAALASDGITCKIREPGEDTFGLISAIQASGTGLLAVGDYRRDGSAGAVRRDPDRPRTFQIEVLAWKRKGMTQVGLADIPGSPRQRVEGWHWLAKPLPASATARAPGPTPRTRLAFPTPASAVRMGQKVTIDPGARHVAPIPWDDPARWCEKPVLKPLEQAFLQRVPTDLHPRRLVEWLMVEVGEGIPYVKLPGSMTAEQLLQRGSGDCAGKARLIDRMLRHRGVPSRLVGGVILKNGAQEVTHLWNDVWIDGRWLPVCSVNQVFGRLPSTWLIVRCGDHKTLEGAGRLLFKVRETTPSTSRNRKARPPRTNRRPNARAPHQGS